LERELYPYEVEECEKSAQEYINNDSFEIEIHNLNEVNEYFRIFKDDILKKEKRRLEEVALLNQQLMQLKQQLELAQPSLSSHCDLSSSRSKSQAEKNQSFTHLEEKPAY